MNTLPHYTGSYPAQAAARMWRRLPRGRAVLFHGTRYPKAILSMNVIRAPEFGYRGVSLTRAFPVALYWALLERDDDEGSGAVLVLDRDRLRQRHKLVLRDEHSYQTRRGEAENEAEEAIERLTFRKDLTYWLIDLDRYLLDIIAVPY